MDERTIKVYDRFADAFSSRYENASGGVSSFFPLLFRGGETVLDIGAGSGRDMTLLLPMGVDVLGIEPSSVLRGVAHSRHESLSSRILPGAIPDDLSSIDSQTFDAVILSAVIQHISDSELLDSAIAIRSILRDGGRLIVSFCEDRPNVDRANCRDSYGRLCVLRGETEVVLFFERIGFQLESKWYSCDGLGRVGIEWITLFLVNRPAALRPIDRIESIINRDRKTATYKLALLRALCDVASFGDKAIEYYPRGTVGIALRDVAKLWVHYYWPLLAEADGLHQTRSKRKFVSFRKPLCELIDLYRNYNGMVSFSADARSGRFVESAEPMYRQAIKAIENAIVRGPVQYAGGARGEREFAFDAIGRRITMSTELWREFVLMGHWVRDSLLLRWSELTRDLNSDIGGISVGSALELLLASDQSDRTDDRVRQYYSEQSDLDCLWTGARLKKMHVDHVIPFALRHDNSLWNLMPVEAKVNADKRAKLPTIGTIDRAKQRFMRYWQMLSEWDPVLFEKDYVRFTGSTTVSNCWVNELWDSLRECVEFTANTRGVERWDPKTDGRSCSTA